MTNTKKRQRTKTDKDKDDMDDKKIVATFCERWDVNMFNSIRELVMPREIEAVLEDKLQEEINDPTFTYRQVHYYPGEFQKGRIYGTGLQSVSKWIRTMCPSILHRCRRTKLWSHSLPAIIG